MNPLLNAQLGQSTHREYEANYGQHHPSEKKGQVQETIPSWQKLAIAAGGIATLIVIVSLIIPG